jgi:hypothetical protein
VSKSIVDVLDRVRTLAQQGPGSVSSANLRALDLAIARRIDGMIAGDFRSAFAGVGTELHQLAPLGSGGLRKELTDPWVLGIDKQLMPGLRIHQAQLADVGQLLLRILSAVGVPHVALSSEGDWLRPPGAFLLRSDRR